MDVSKQEHYASLKIEPIDIIKEDMSLDEYRGFLKGNIIKYTLRKKGDPERDAAKLMVYTKWLKESYENTKTV